MMTSFMNHVLPMVVFTTVCVLSLSVTAEPNYPSDWTANVEQNSITWEGGSYNATSGQACCSTKAAQCQLRAIGESVNEYVDGSKNASLLTNGEAGVLSLYEEESDASCAIQNRQRLALSVLLQSIQI